MSDINLTLADMITLVIISVPIIGIIGINSVIIILEILIEIFDDKENDKNETRRNI